MIHREIRPQEGYQEAFLSSPADIVIGGGSAGSGKSYSLLLEPIRHIKVPGFGGVIFRRTTPQITNEGGLWDTCYELYPYVSGVPNKTSLTWKFPQGTKIKFSHLEYEDNKLDWQGTQIPYIGFDELTHFSRGQFFYLLGRNRSSCGIRPYIRATCNPDPDSWVADLLSWWIDQDSGYPIPERCGKLRYFISDAGNLVWGDNPQEVIDKCPHVFDNPEFVDMKIDDLVKSITFIPGTIYENKKLLAVNPAYLGNLLSLDEAEQMQLLKGNWKIRQDGTALFNYQKISDLFSNFIEAGTFKCITVDYARQGQDLTVMKTWTGMQVDRIEIMTTSSTVEAFDMIEAERKRTSISRSSVVVDEDGVGGGVVDLSNGEYKGFHANTTSAPDPITGEKENYANLKTQCAYRYADLVNAGKAAINLQNIIVDGSPAEEVRVRGKLVPVRKLITDDLRAIKKKNMDKDGKKQISSKDEQKNILSGRSPDFFDSLFMRLYFDLNKPPEPGIRFL